MAAPLCRSQRSVARGIKRSPFHGIAWFDFAHHKSLLVVTVDSLWEGEDTVALTPGQGLRKTASFHPRAILVLKTHIMHCGPDPPVRVYVRPSPPTTQLQHTKQSDCLCASLSTNSGLSPLRQSGTMHRRVFNDPGHVHFLTFSCYHKHQFLTDDRVRSWLTDSISTAGSKHNIAIWAYVIMPDHVHMLVHPISEMYSISRFLRDIKEPVRHRLVRYFRDNAPTKLELMKARQGRREVHRLWQAGGGFDRNLTDWDRIQRAIEYIEWNPVRRGFVSTPRTGSGQVRVPERA